MDPLSITLAVVTFTTALKDIIELSQKIKKSFSKVSQNTQNAQRLADEVLQDLLHLQEFCEGNSATLSTSNEMQAALAVLMKEMDISIKKCNDLIPPLAEKMIGRLKVAVYAWRHCNEIEATLLKLRDHIRACHQRFMTISLARIEGRLVGLSTMFETHLTLGNNATRTTKLILDEFPRTTQHKPSDGTVSTEQIAAFIGSSTTLMSKLPKSRPLVELTADIVSSLYLTLQVNAIDKSLFELSSGLDSYYVAPLDLYRQPFQIQFVDLYSTKDHLLLHQQAVHETLQIQSVLRSPDSNTSLQNGAWMMGNLSVVLAELGMYREATKICGWVVRIFRTLVRIDREVYNPYLVHSLLILSDFFTEVDNLEAAHEAISESVGIGWSLPMPSSLIRERSRVLLSSSLTRSASVLYWMGEDTRTLLNASEAVRVLEELFSDHSVSQEISTESGFILREFKWDKLLKIMEYGTISHYAQALYRLSFILHELEFPTATIQVATKAVEIFHLVSPFYPEGFWEDDLTDLLELISELEENLPP